MWSSAHVSRRVMVIVLLEHLASKAAYLGVGTRIHQLAELPVPCEQVFPLVGGGFGAGLVEVRRVKIREVGVGAVF